MRRCLCGHVDDDHAFTSACDEFQCECAHFEWDGVEPEDDEAELLFINRMGTW